MGCCEEGIASLQFNNREQGGWVVVLVSNLITGNRVGGLL